jgi:hypothetical protein
VVGRSSPHDGNLKRTQCPVPHPLVWRRRRTKKRKHRKKRRKKEKDAVHPLGEHPRDQRCRWRSGQRSRSTRASPATALESPLHRPPHTRTHQRTTVIITSTTEQGKVTHLRGKPTQKQIRDTTTDTDRTQTRKHCPDTYLLPGIWGRVESGHHSPLLVSTLPHDHLTCLRARTAL